MELMSPSWANSNVTSSRKLFLITLGKKKRPSALIFIQICYCACCNLISLFSCLSHLNCGQHEGKGCLLFISKSLVPTTLDTQQAFDMVAEWMQEWINSPGALKTSTTEWAYNYYVSIFSLVSSQDLRACKEGRECRTARWWGRPDWNTLT